MRYEADPSGFVNAAGSNVVISGGVISALKSYVLWADNLENPVNAGWTVNALAPAIADEDDLSKTVRAFDDTTEEGVGFEIPIPTGATSIIFKFRSRGRTAPGAARTVGLKLYTKEFPDNSATGAWSAGTALTDIDIPTNENSQYDSQTIALSTLSLTAGRDYKFELTRVNPSAGTELVGDWYLRTLIVEFS